MIALTRTLKEIPDTFEGPSFKIVKIIPFGYKRVDIVAGSYQPNSIRHCYRQISTKFNQCLSAKQAAYHPKSIQSHQNQEYLAILPTFYQTLKTKREWFRLYIAHIREKTGFELLEDQLH